MAKSKTPDAIQTKRAGLPQHCPACWFGVPQRSAESGAVTRLTCLNCGWSERYRVTDAV